MPIELSPEVINDLQALQDTHKELRKEIERAETAGLDMTEYKAKLEELERVRSGLIKVYGGPNRRRNVS